MSSIVFLDFSAEAVKVWWTPLAYLDPGSGSYLLQILIAGVLGGLLMLRVYWTRVIGFIRRLFGGADQNDGE